MDSKSSLEWGNETMPDLNFEDKKPNKKVNLNPKHSIKVNFEDPQNSNPTNSNKTPDVVNHNENTPNKQDAVVKKVINSFKPINFDEEEVCIENSDYVSLRKIRDELVIDFQKNVKYRSSHECYYSVCGEVEGIENLTSIYDHNNETVLRTGKWVIAKKYEVLFSDLNLLLVKERINISIDQFRGTLNDIDPEILPKILTKNLPDRIGIKNNVDEELERILALAIIFYTNSKSEYINRMTAISIYSYFMDKNLKISENLIKIEETKQNHEEIKQTEEIACKINLINSFLYSALSLLPLYWGYCTRYVDLKKDDFECYKPGRIICWFQFSSSSISGENSFKGRNTMFKIKSQTGRIIQMLSCYNYETEVLFLPFSQFIVQKVEKEGDKTHISLKQIELGIGEQNVLWVDDHIHEETWENKSIIEKSFTCTTTVKFILKNSTETALAYLESIWGQDKKNKFDTFRIISDMNRPDEVDGENAGAKFFKECLRLGFNCKMMIFTSNVLDSKRKLERFDIQSSNIVVTSRSEDAFNFITFK